MASQEEACPAAAGTAAARFTVLSYNILSRSLGSNCVPWVMHVREEALLRRVEGAVGVPWARWKESEVFPVYKRHFHKNLPTGDYTTMRRLWSARRLTCQADVPSTLQGVRFHAEDQVTYTTPKGEQAVASTMRGLLRAKLPEDSLGLQLFEHLMELEEEVYAWPTRGPRLFREIVAPRVLQQSPTAPSSGSIVVQPADVIVLQEYDAHTAVADYRGIGREEPLPAALEAEGYAGILFKDPLKGRSPPSGIGIFWRRAALRLPGASSAVEETRQMELECSTSLGDVAHNTDFLEHWHRLRPGAQPERELMAEADRRHAASVTLEHVGSGRKLRVVSAHLMTTSRDSEASNEFPGEVRAGELGTLREELRRSSSGEEALLLAGDFNTDAGSLDVFAGRLRSSLTGEPLLVRTGLEDVGGGSCASGGGRSLRWRLSEPEEPPRSLREAFESVHRWGEGVGRRAEGGHCTSTNADRTEWIDYVWYDEALLRPLALSNCATPAGPMPDREHGSDHLPVAVHFEFAPRMPEAAG